jgi:hypothetical protein
MTLQPGVGKTAAEASQAPFKLLSPTFAAIYRRAARNDNIVKHACCFMAMLRLESEMIKVTCREDPVA